MEELAAQLNSLTVPGLPLREHDLQSAAVLQAAGGALLQVLPVRCANNHGDQVAHLLGNLLSQCSPLCFARHIVLLSVAFLLAMVNPRSTPL